MLWLDFDLNLFPRYSLKQNGQLDFSNPDVVRYVWMRMLIYLGYGLADIT